MIPGNTPMEFSAACFTALLLGITSGISQCSVFCAPVVSTHIMGSKEGAVEGFKSYVVFSVGRVFMCLLLGLAAGYAGAAFTGSDGIFKHGSAIYTAMLILIGFVMLVRPVCGCKKTENKKGWFPSLGGRFLFNPTAHLFVMGTALAAIPCPPMVAMLLYSLEMPSIIWGGIIMVLFGIGTAVSPFVIICVLAGWFSKKIKAVAPQYRMMFQRLSGLILILLGGSLAIL